MPDVIIKKGKEEYGESSYRMTKEILKKLNFKVKNKRVILKPNLVTEDCSESGITTDPSICRAVLERLKSCEVTIVEDYPNFKTTGYEDLAEEFDAELLALDELDRKDIVMKRVPKPIIFKKIPMSKQVLESDYIISCAKLKIHGLCQVTLTLKNMFGLVPGRRNRVIIHPYIRRALLDIIQIVYPNIGIIDGIIGNQVDEVASHPVKHGLVIGGYNPLATDIVGCKCMGIDPMEIEFIKSAIDFYNFDIKNINVIGEDIGRVAKKYVKERALSTQFRYLMEKASSRFLRFQG